MEELQLMTSQTLRFTFDQKLKGWPEKRKRREDRNTKKLNLISQEQKDICR